MVHNYLKHFISLSHKIYPQELNIDSLAGLEQDVIGFCQKNRFAHYFALSFIQTDTNTALRKLRGEYEVYLKNRENNLTALHKALPMRDWVVIKTFSSYPHLTHDIDVVVSPGYNLDFIRDTMQSVLGEANSFDLHTRVSWTPSQEVSDDFFWKHVVSKKIGELTIYIPNTLLDALIRIAHIPFEQGSIRFGELLHLFRQLEKVDNTLLENEATKCGWGKTYQRMMKLINALHEDMFGMSTSGRTVSKEQKSIVFPVKVPLTLLADATIEKRAWGKLWGARYLLKDRMGL